jgi:phenylpropionate dioxygenase-like ring-hydroxylating dioxygenase large terminal subunit
MSAPVANDRLPSTPLDRQPTPSFGSELISKQRYISAEFAARERDKMWNRVWLLAGLERDIPSPGDYFSFEIASESVLVIRQRDGGLAARYNVCMHRGNRLCEPGRGHVSRFTCGYHAWQYDLDGSLASVQDPDTFPQGCPKERLSLRPVRCDSWGSFVWINLDPDAEPLRDYLDIIPEHLDPYHFEEMRVMNDVTVEIPCNWKTSVDAFNEAYHIAGTHPDTLELNDDTNVPIDCYERHSRMLLQLGVASPRLASHGQISDVIRESFLRRAGIDPDRFEGGAQDVRPAIAKAVRDTQGPALGVDFSELLDAQLTDDFHYVIFPNITLNIFGRSAWLFRHRPHPSDPNRMYFDLFNLVRLPNADLERPDHEFHQCSDDLRIDLLGGGGDLLAQDTYNLPRIQQGMHSAGFEGLHLGDQELRIRHFHSVLDRYLDAPSR